MSPEDFRRLKSLDWIVPPARPYFDQLIGYATSQGFQPYIVSAVRKCSEEGPQSKTSRSWHVLGRAVDVELHARGQAATLEDAYSALGAWWENLGGIWGGRWTDLYPVPHPYGWCGPPSMAGDPCHFQWTEGHTGVPEAIWPKAVTSCVEVDRLQASYLASQASWLGAPLIPSAAPGGLGTAPGARAGLILPAAVLTAVGLIFFGRKRKKG
jgi:hypothetical protein